MLRRRGKWGGTVMLGEREESERAFSGELPTAARSLQVPAAPALSRSPFAHLLLLPDQETRPLLLFLTATWTLLDASPQPRSRAAGRVTRASFTTGHTPQLHPRVCKFPLLLLSLARRLHICSCCQTRRPVPCFFSPPRRVSTASLSCSRPRN
jgi:hypothetical protein